jgi:hypothetical protein
LKESLIFVPTERRRPFFPLYVDFDIDEILSICFGGSGSKGNIDGGDESRMERIEIARLLCGAFLCFEVAYIKPPGTLIVSIFSRRLSDDWVVYASVRLENLDTPDCREAHTSALREDT